jgi:hypothetical protein
MNELVALIVKKTGIPQATAVIVVNLVADYLEKKLPAPMAATVKGFLSNETEVKQAESVVGGLLGKMGKKK